MIDDPEPRNLSDSWQVKADPADGDLRFRLGYENLILARRARQWLSVAHPEWSPATLDQQVRFAVSAWWHGRPSYREISEAIVARAQWAARRGWKDGSRSRGLPLTQAEARHVLEHFSGANDDLGRSILSKVQELLA